MRRRQRLNGKTRTSFFRFVPVFTCRRSSTDVSLSGLPLIDAHDSDSARVMSAGILLKEVKRIAGKNKFVITGDFNMRPDSRAYSIITESGAKNPFLTDSYKISATVPAGPEGTTNGWSDIPRNGRIDYVFVRSGLRIKSIETIVKKDGPVFISDHWPVKAVVEF